MLSLIFLNIFKSIKSGLKLKIDIIFLNLAWMDFRTIWNSSISAESDQNSLFILI